MDHLRNTVLSLASKPEIQVRLFPNGTCKGDELVLDYDNWYQAVEKENLSQNEVEALDSLDRLIASYSGKEFEEMYLEERALFKDNRWEEIRAKAKEVMHTFEWKMDTPQKNESTYVINSEVIENK